MRRTVVVLPHLIGETPDDSPLRQKLPALQTMAELGALSRLSAIPKVETPEALWLGLKPNEGQMRQGPLTVSALGQDPPDRSIHFHVSLLGLQDGVAVEPAAIIRADELRQVVEQAKRLSTRSLTFLEGENKDHALVWEGVGDLHTVAASEIVGKPIKSNLPEGDAERELRRFIDDSVNLLNELDLNERRIDEGLAPLNLLWPWGHGMRKPVPNLLLKRGESARVESNSLRLAGLTRLTGYRHGDRHAFGRGTNTRLEQIAKTALQNDAAILVIDAPQEFRKLGQIEELHWFTKELDERLLKPLLDESIKTTSRISLVATGPTGGLALRFETGDARQNVYPYDERSLEEKALSTTDAWTFIEKSLEPLPQL